MNYRIDLSLNAERDIIRHGRSGVISTLSKIDKLLVELETHPTTGTGHPEPLGGDKAGQWSRRVTGKHRLVYMIEEEKGEVKILSAWGHYNDK